VNTQLGRVVYDRKKNPFTKKDLERIIRHFYWDKTPEEASHFLAEVVENSAYHESITKEWRLTFLSFFAAQFVQFGVYIPLEQQIEVLIDSITDVFHLSGSTGGPMKASEEIGRLTREALNKRRKQRAGL